MFEYVVVVVYVGVFVVLYVVYVLDVGVGE